MSRRTAALLAGALLSALFARPARAQSRAPSGAGADGVPGIDDPKVARRLETRADAASVAELGDPAASLSATAVPPAPAGPHVPRLKLAYRRFSFVRVGAASANSTSGTAASEPFNVVSLDVYPVSSIVRFGLSSEYGAQSGTFTGGGDYILTESVTLGGQFPFTLPADSPWRQITPFAEGFAGGGYMRRRQFDHSIPTVYWQLGFDVGAELYVTGRAYVSFGVGYIHPVNGFATTTMPTSTSVTAAFTTVFVDTWSLKIGIGI
jgi:hypothetical protein